MRARLAPSPTGLLHLGNAWSFLLAWLMCRKNNGQLILRIEDIDPERSRQEFCEAIYQDLSWLGLGWDEGPYFQSQRLDIYSQIISEFKSRNIIYPCYCTRKELRSLAGAPQVGDFGAAYSGICRNLSTAQRLNLEQARTNFSLRLRCPDSVYTFTDLIQGMQSATLSECGGDFALCRSDGVFAYQLAVSVDDALMKVTQVVRGADILGSTFRQLALFEFLNLPAPDYAHIPLICDWQGKRLAKRHQSLSLQALRENGIKPEAIIGYLAFKGGLLNICKPLSANELLNSFNIHAIAKTDILLDEDFFNILQFLA